LARAEQSVATSKARLASLKAEADGIREDLIAIATRQAARLIAQAEETGGRRLADASLVAEQSVVMLSRESGRILRQRQSLLLKGKF